MTFVKPYACTRLWKFSLGLGIAALLLSCATTREDSIDFSSQRSFGPADTDTSNHLERF